MTTLWVFVAVGPQNISIKTRNKRTKKILHKTSKTSTIIATIVLNYGRLNEEKRTIALRMEQEDVDVVVGTIDFTKNTRCLPLSL